MNEMEWRHYRLQLPHLRMLGATYFVTWRLHRSQQDLTGPERDVVASALRHFEGERYALPAWVVMNDHVHAVVRPHDAWPLEKLTHSWKSFSSHAILKQSLRVAPVWLNESYDRIVRNEEELREKVNYVLNNPLKRWPSLTDYPWVGCSVSG